MVILLGLTLLSPVSFAQAKHHRKAHKAVPKPAKLPPMRPGPLPQLPMDLMPAAPPKVSFQDGLLTISAQNSTLGDILRDVHKLTGAAIDVPPNVTERVVTRLGPGAPRDVLASLLNGSTFNYVMLGSSSDPTALANVVLTAKPAVGTTQTASNTYQPPQPGYPAQMPPQPFAGQPVVVQQPVVAQPAPADGDDTANAEEPDAADENADQDQTDPQQPDTNGAAQPDQQQPPQPPQPNAGPKTPEQILEMLRRQQPPGQPGVPAQQQPPEN